MILVTLNQRWMFKNIKTKVQSIYRERVGRLISQPDFIFEMFKNEYCIEFFMFYFFMEKDFESKDWRKRKRKKKDV